MKSLEMVLKFEGGVISFSSFFPPTYQKLAIVEIIMIKLANPIGFL